MIQNPEAHNDGDRTSVSVESGVPSQQSILDKDAFSQSRKCSATKSDGKIYIINYRVYRLRIMFTTISRVNHIAKFKVNG